MPSTVALARPTRHIRQLAHINLTCLPSLSRAYRSKTLDGSVRQIVVARPSFVASLVVILAASRTPVPVSSGSSISAAENGRGEGGVVLSVSRGRVSTSPARHGARSVAAAKEWHATPRRRGGISTLSRPGRSVCLSVSTRSIFISTPRAINLRHRALLRRLQASQRPSHPLTAGPGRAGPDRADCPAPIDSQDSRPRRVVREVQRARSGRTDGQNE